MIENYIDNIFESVKLEDGKQIIKNILINIYLEPGISNKDLARNHLLPIPVVVAIKKEFIKVKIIIQDRGIRLTDMGNNLVKEELGFLGLNYDLYRKFRDCSANISEINDLENSIIEIFNNRPKVDLTIDQTKCTVDTAIKRALLCLQKGRLIGNKILCVGDDDLVSVALGFLVKKLYNNMKGCKTFIHVIDIDTRILEYIENIARKYALPIKCEHHDLKNPLFDIYLGKFDCIFTDPPYTLEGMNLFISRGLEAIKKDRGNIIFLSFSHKSLLFTYEMQKCFIKMGLVVSEIIPSFNVYEGAGIIGNKGQMIILKTTSNAFGLIAKKYNNPIYTREIKALNSK